MGQCEWADYPTKVLEKHWPSVPRWRGIRTLTKENFYERTGLETVDVISCGFPCQPHSIAGKRLASGDERNLWPEMRRVIGEIKPRWVVGENVLGLLSSENGRFFRGILRDFAELGYDVGWGVTSAAAVGAVHRRNRVAIVAHANCEPMEGVRLQHSAEVQRQENGCEKIWNPTFAVFEQLRSDCGCFYTWNDKPVKPLIARIDDGIPHRVDRLKCLGNAVVPQQFYPVFRAIADVEALLSGGENGGNDGTTD